MGRPAGEPAAATPYPGERLGRGAPGPRPAAGRGCRAELRSDHSGYVTCDAAHPARTPRVRSGAPVPVALTIASVSGSLPCMGTYRTLGIEALADPSRRAIFELLGAGPQSVVAIAGSVPISRPAVSQHLKVLKDAGLVTVQAVGTRRIYALDPAGVGAARDYFDQFWTTALAAYTQTANTIKEEQ
jgi:DNA-binding transcriptional ArsR family regulator